MALPAFIQTEETIEVVCLSDEAIDQEKTDVEKYLDSLDYHEHVTLRDGIEPTVFTIAPMSARDMGYAINVYRQSVKEEDDYSHKVDVVRRCLRGVSGLFKYEAKDDLLDRDSWSKVSVDYTSSMVGHGAFKQEVAATSVTDWIPPTAIEELYFFIDRISTVSEDLKKN